LPHDFAGNGVLNVLVGKYQTDICRFRAVTLSLLHLVVNWPLVLCIGDLNFISPLSFDNGWTDYNANCCIDTVDEKVVKAKNWANFGQGTLAWQSLLWRETATATSDLPSWLSG